MQEFLQWIDKEIEELVEKVRNLEKLNEIHYIDGSIDSLLKMKQYLKTKVVLNE
jgi:hypothetical protein